MEIEARLRQLNPARFAFPDGSTRGVISFEMVKEGVCLQRARLSCRLSLDSRRGWESGRANINELAARRITGQWWRTSMRSKRGWRGIAIPCRSSGAPAETIDALVARAIDITGATERAVTLEDYERLAQRTPGARLARAAARANLHPSFPCFQAPGIVTLIILPDMPVARPVPSPGLLRLVAAYLHYRRIVGTRVEVVAPTYLEVSVSASVKAHAGVSIAHLQRRIVEALNDFLDPLKGGSDGNGWPFGRDVYRSEVMQVIDESREWTTLSRLS